MRQLTQEQLKELVNYDPETGIFTRKKDHWCTKKGDVLGSPHKGPNTIYLRANICGQRYYLHVLAFLYMTGFYPVSIGHINQDGLDNRWANLREANKIDNARNTRLRKDNTSGKHGVRWNAQYQHWRVDIGVRGTTVHLGCTRTFEEACALRDNAEKFYGFHENHGRL